MSNYVKITDYAAKDALLTGNPAKLVKGTEIGADFDAVAVAVATKADTTSPTLVTPVLGVATATSINGNTITTGTGTLTLGAGSTLATSATNSITLTSTGATNVTLPTTGTLATLAGTEELDNKTLDASVAKGTWTASGTWTIPAATLGGAITGGGQNVSGLGTLGCGALTAGSGTFGTTSAQYLVKINAQTTGSPGALLFARSSVSNWYNSPDGSGGIRWSLDPATTSDTDLTTATKMRLSSSSLAVTGALSATGTISPQQATTAGAPAYVKGAIYFDTTLNKLRVGGATAWETITSV